MQQVWVVRRRQTKDSPWQLVVLLHSADGRVSVAQLLGEGGQIPRLYGHSRDQKTCAIWGAKAWRWGNHGVGGIGQYRKSYDVPKCSEVLAVTLEDNGTILIVHRPRPKDMPQLWTITRPQEQDTGEGPGASLTSFFRVHHPGNHGGKGKGKSGHMGAFKGGSWFDDRWGTTTARQIILPDDLVVGTPQQGLGEAGEPAPGSCPLFLPVSTLAEVSGVPEVEILRFTGFPVPEAQLQEHVRPRRAADAWPPSFYWEGLASSGAPPPVPLVTWKILGRLHYTCRQPLAPL